MQKLFRTSAWLMAILFAVGMVGLIGCGDDDDDDEVIEDVTLVSTAPADGGAVAAGSPLSITFSGEPGAVTVNGAAATVNGKTATFTIPEGDAGQTKAYAISWADGAQTVTLTVGAIDKDAPVLESSDLEDGDEDVEYDGLEEIRLMFNEPLDTVKSRNISIAPDGGSALKWTLAWEDGDATVALIAGKGATLSAETTYVISGKATDLAGNETDVDITFTTRAKE